MPSKTKNEQAEAIKSLTYLASALKAPRITEAASRLADHARDAGWTHEEYLAAVLDREVAARNASGAQLRIRAAGFGSRKTLEEFDVAASSIPPATFDYLSSLERHYAAWIGAWSACPVLPIDTDELDLVRDPAARRDVVALIAERCAA